MRVIASEAKQSHLLLFQKRQAISFWRVWGYNIAVDKLGLSRKKKGKIIRGGVLGI